jgi:hypothetical protein
VDLSWRSKVERAEHHLSDFKALIAPYEGRRAYPVSEKLETDGDEALHVHRLDIPEPEDPVLPVIAGDILFNLRSALDHIAVAMVRRPTNNTAFPIFGTDIEQLDGAGTGYLHADDRARWERITKGFPKGAMPIVERAQPYRHRREGRDPQYVSIALLRTFQNADKHRRLVLVVSGLRDPIIWFDLGNRRKKRVRLPGIAGDRRLGPGTVIGRNAEPLPPNVKMEAEGTLDIMIGDSKRRRSPDVAFHSCPDVFESMIQDVTGLLDLLESYAIHTPRK